MVDAGELDEYLLSEGNRALAVGGLYSALFGYVISAGLTVVVALGDRFFVVPMFFALSCAVYSTILWRVARKGAVRGAAGWALMLVFVSLPSGFFIAAQFTYPGGAGNFLTGPISLLYCFVIVITGFLFNPRLTFVAGLVAAGEYLAFWFADRDFYARILAPTSIMHTDLTSTVVWLNKGATIAGVGLGTAALGRLSRRLLVRILKEEREKAMLDRLFALYHSDEVKKAILAHAQKPRAERKQVAVLFSDVRGFSTFSEGRDPAVVVEHLNAYLSRMVDAIAQEGGVVDKFIGDAVMAVFGGVVDLANPASAALRAARRMRDALAGLHADGIEFESGIGIHFGEVLQGPIGSEHRREFTVIGDTVNIASRVEGLTKEKGVPLLVTGEVYERLSSDERVSFSSLGEAKVKGRAAPVALWG